MFITKSWYKRVDCRLAKILLTAIISSSLTACGLRIWEPSAPQRSFNSEQLFLEEYPIPSTWKVYGPTSLVGDDLCGAECVSLGFRETNPSLSGYAGHNIYRYHTIGIAQRTFEKVYLSPLKLSGTVNEWTYESSLADRSHFSCNYIAGNIIFICEWAGQYEEYIVLFYAQIGPGEMSLAGMEDVVKAIDLHMSENLR